MISVIFLSFGGNLKGGQNQDTVKFLIIVTIITLLFLWVVRSCGPPMEHYYKYNRHSKQVPMPILSLW